MLSERQRLNRTSRGLGCISMCFAGGTPATTAIVGDAPRIKRLISRLHAFDLYSAFGVPCSAAFDRELEARARTFLSPLRKLAHGHEPLR
jgi:hypothetical protein